ncbi:MAG: ribose-phosphate pyrophosphokinase [Anaerolineae bacterium]|nr:ribose-phosphate pyrophosphokinase [Anaerolineae bacterium]
MSTEAEFLKNVAIFSGSAHIKLAGKLAAYLGLELSPISIDKFSNDNIEVQLGVSVRGKHVFLVQPLVPPTSDNLVELLLMLDIARMSGAKSIHAVIPHYSYGRSDKKDAPRISISARLVADMLTVAGAQHVISMTMHSPQVHGFFSVPTDHLTAHSVFVEHFRQQDLTDTVIVSPDIGNAKRADKLAHSLNVPLAVGQKKRISDDRVTIGSILGEVKGKRAIIFDDEIATGGSIVELVERLKFEGAGPISVAATHGLFLKKAKKRLDELDVTEIVTTNTVPVRKKRRPERLVTLDVAHIFGEVIRRTLVGESIGELFEFWPDS